MARIGTVFFRDRIEAGHLLSQRLKGFDKSNTVVVGIPNGGVKVAAAIASELSLPLEVLPCRKIKHPADSSRSIGAVSMEEAFVHANSHNIPQDYIYHQLVMLRHSMSNELSFYYGTSAPRSLKGKIVVLADDIMKSGDSMMVSIRNIRRQEPARIIAAVPIVTELAMRSLRDEVDEFLFLRTGYGLHTGHDVYEEFPRVHSDEVKDILGELKDAAAVSAS
jgi:putative phosphoribosyl transferase